MYKIIFKGESEEHFLENITQVSKFTGATHNRCVKNIDRTLLADVIGVSNLNFKIYIVKNIDDEIRQLLSDRFRLSLSSAVVKSLKHWEVDFYINQIPKVSDFTEDNTKHFFDKIIGGRILKCTIDVRIK